MKKSQEILGLSIISIAEGKEIGKVKDLVINSQQGSIECLVVDNDAWYLGLKMIPFSLVQGVGEYAVTIENETAISDTNDLPNVNELLKQNIQVKGTKVLTKKGKLIGTVTEFIVDEENGKIAGCEFAPVNAPDQVKIIPAKGVVTFGKDVLVVTENIENNLLNSLVEQSQFDASNVEAASTTTTYTATADEAQEKKQSQADAAKLFEERQRQFLLGRKLTKQLQMASGEIIAEEGEIITEEIIEKAKSVGKYMELTMNTTN